jgi:transposase
MLRRKETEQTQFELVTYDILVRPDHLLRKIDKAIDFSFIYDLCEPLYCPDNGRPAVDPEVLFRMLFIGYLYGIKSEVRLCEEVNDNVAYRWFCGLGLTEKVPDHATISSNRRRRFRDNDIAEKIFNEILRQAIKNGLVGGRILYIDSTHVKAKANKHKKVSVEVERTPKAYIKELDEAIEKEREELGKKPFVPKDGPPSTHIIQQSRTDPDSGQLHKEGKPDGFHYSEHRTVDSKHNIIVNTHITGANVNDCDAIPDVLKEIESRLGSLPLFMGLDAGYHNAPVAHQLRSRNIQPVLGHRRHTHAHDTLSKHRFRYNPELNCYICPEGCLLEHKTTDRDGYRHYCSDARTCKGCPGREKCFAEKSVRKVVTRHVWQDDLEQADAFTKTPAGKNLYSWRKQTIERSFADAKQLHGLRYARMLGLANMREQAFLTAAVQNMKKIASLLWQSLSCLWISFFSTPACPCLP